MTQNLAKSGKKNHRSQELGLPVPGRGRSMYLRKPRPQTAGGEKKKKTSRRVFPNQPGKKSGEQRARRGKSATEGYVCDEKKAGGKKLAWMKLHRTTLIGEKPGVGSEHYLDNYNSTHLEMHKRRKNQDSVTLKIQTPSRGPGFTRP